jgi:hypothetical protein
MPLPVRQGQSVPKGLMLKSPPAGLVVSLYTYCLSSFDLGYIP